MDARDQLRRYLEQRRELGETELVLDGMTVEETLKILGARGASGGAGAGASAARIDREAPRPAAGSEGTADWRETLRAAGAAPEQKGAGDQAADSGRLGDWATGRPPESPAAQSPALESPAVEIPAAQSPAVESPDRPLADIPRGITVSGTGRPMFGDPAAGLDTLDAIAARVAACTRCALHSTATNPVPGEGNPDADLMFVGEAPGATEDETGRPFVGAAGQLLTKIIAAIDLKREDVFICNVLKHRPPGNRNPLPDEVAACSPYLVRQIELIRPKVIVALGTFAAQTLLETKLSIGKLRAQIHHYHGVPLVVTYHPAALLRNPSWKRPTWEDVQLARRILDSAADGA